MLLNVRMKDEQKTGNHHLNEWGYASASWPCYTYFTAVPYAITSAALCMMEEDE